MLNKSLVKTRFFLCQKIPDFLEEFDFYNYRFYNKDLIPFDENKEYDNDLNSINKEKELKFNDKYDKYERGYDKQQQHYRHQYNNNYRGRGYKNYNRGNYYKFKRNNEYNGNYHKGNNDSWRK